MRRASIRAHQAGIDHHLVKPIDPETLKDQLAGHPPPVRQGAEGSW